MDTGQVNYKGRKVYERNGQKFIFNGQVEKKLRPGAKLKTPYRAYIPAGSPVVNSGKINSKKRTVYKKDGKLYTRTVGGGYKIFRGTEAKLRVPGGAAAIGPAPPPAVINANGYLNMRKINYRGRAVYSKDGRMYIKGPTGVYKVFRGTRLRDPVLAAPAPAPPQALINANGYLNMKKIDYRGRAVYSKNGRMYTKGPTGVYTVFRGTKLRNVVPAAPAAAQGPVNANGYTNTRKLNYKARAVYSKNGKMYTKGPTGIYTVFRGTKLRNAVPFGAGQAAPAFVIPMGIYGEGGPGTVNNFNPRTNTGKSDVQGYPVI